MQSAASGPAAPSVDVEAAVRTDSTARAATDALAPPRTITGRPPAPDLNFGSRAAPSGNGYLAGLASVSLERPQQNVDEPLAPKSTVGASSCPACGTTNPTESSFCCECGATLRPKNERPLGATIVAVGAAGGHAPLEAVSGGASSGSGRTRPSPVFDAPPASDFRVQGSSAPPRSESSPATERTFGDPGGGSAAVARAPRRDPRPEPPSEQDLRAPGALPPFQTCPRCRGANSAEARFCQLCGVALGTTGAAQVSPAPDSEPRSGLLPTAWLVVIGQDGTPGRRYPLASPSMEIGRTAGEILLEKDPYVCPRHARLTYGSRGFAIQDVGSVNGVYVRLGASPVELRHGDLLLMGQAVLRFEIVEETEGRLSPAVRDSTRVFGSPAVARRARLVLQTVEGCGRDIFYVSRPETILGREAGDIVFTDDPFMSRRHAALRRASATNTYTLRDLGSSNGTFIAIRGQQSLSPGDHVRIGQHLFRLDVQSGGPS